MPLGSFNPHSPQTHLIAGLFTGILILAAIIFLLVCGLVAYSIVRFRARNMEQEPIPSRGSKRLEIAWTAIPLVIVTVIFILSVRAMALIDAPDRPQRPADLVVTGHQWWWDARYPDGTTAVGEFHIPVSRRILVRLESADVIHDFWVPQLARKMDAVPGRSSYIWLEADSPATYLGVCAEFCGTQHAWMQFRIIAEPEADFAAWLKRQSQPAVQPGLQLFQEKKCAECHAPGSSKGPDLTHVASRQFLGAGISKNTRANLALWVAKPQSVKPGNRMPDQQLSKDEVDALTAYLETLR